MHEKLLDLALPQTNQDGRGFKETLATVTRTNTGPTLVCFRENYPSHVLERDHISLQTSGNYGGSWQN